jgi:uncharacterized protein (DUF1800 family)
MLNRRQFHALLFSTVASRVLSASPTLATPTTLAPDPADLWLNRLSFGATQTSRAEFNALGAQGWLEAQLAMPATDPQMDERLKSATLWMEYEAGEDENGHKWPATSQARPLTTLFSSPADEVFRINWDLGMDYSERTRPAHEVISASMIRAVHCTAQLREVMTQFWHDHFNVNSLKDEGCAAFFPSHDAIMRAHAFGNFRAFLGAVAKSPSMLYYLNNADSTASPANENYARELLELHCLGATSYLNDQYSVWSEVPGAKEGLAIGYLDLDVYEVARAFTGWSVGDGRYINDGENAPQSGMFHYVEAWHDPYQKRVLGIEFLPNRAPMADGEQVLDILASHPATARFVCKKIARRLLADDPDAGLVDMLADVFVAHRTAPDQIAQVIRALVNDQRFSATPAGKMRRPFEFLAAIYRASGAQVINSHNDFQWPLMRAGWRQHEYGPPTGHPDVMAKWTGASSLNRLVEIALLAHEDWFGVAPLKLDRLQNDTETIADLLARWTGLFNQDATAFLAAIDTDPNTPAADFTQEERQGAVAGAIAFAALTPNFMLR